MSAMARVHRHAGDMEEALNQASGAISIVEEFVEADVSVEVNIRLELAHGAAPKPPTPTGTPPLPTPLS